jgi:hypothetical protein
MLDKDNRIRSAAFVRIIDGDTFTARLDLTPSVSPAHECRANIRVKGWNAEELREEEGPYMRDQFAAILQAAQTIDVKLEGMSFTRIVCSVWVDGVLFEGLLRERLNRFRLGHG